MPEVLEINVKAKTYYKPLSYDKSLYQEKIPMSKETWNSIVVAYGDDPWVMDILTKGYYIA